MAPPVPPPPPEAEPVLAMEEIQGNILAGFNKDYQTFLFLAIEPGGTAPAVVKRWIRALAPRIATAAEVLEFNNLFRRLRSRRGEEPRGLVATWVNIAFSAAAVRRLVGEAEVARFGDGKFGRGLAADAHNLNDPADPAHEGHPSRWVVGGPGKEADILLIVASDDPGSLSAEVARLEDSIYSATTPEGTRVSDALRVVYKQHGATLPPPLTGHEHFGFKDGVSQPGVRGRTSDAANAFLAARLIDPDDPSQRNARRIEYSRPGQPLLWPGQFVFGYRRQDPAHRRRLGPGRPHTPVPVWAFDGSYLVCRRLRQDVAGFRQAMRDLAAGLVGTPFETTPARLAALLVGRWPSGAPLVRTDEENLELGADSLANNRFVYDFQTPPQPLRPDLGHSDTFPPPRPDEQGFICPFAAHVRKVNPRDKTTELGDEANTLTHLVLRRGIPFGDPLPDPEPANGDPLRGERGLMFLCYQTSIEEQFAILNENWANHPTAPNGGGGHDLIIGEAGPTDRARFIDLKRPGSLQHRIDVKPEPDRLNEWVLPTGGGYFLSPSISALTAAFGGTPEELAALVERLRPRLEALEDPTPPDSGGPPPDPPDPPDPPIVLPDPDEPSGGPDASQPGGPAMPGTFPTVWNHGSDGCARREEPLQVHQYDADTWIMRESKCADPGTRAAPGPSFEAPFMYLLLGEQRALLLDTGTSPDERVVPIGPRVREILAQRARERGEAPLPLVVAHSHGHGDHTAGDAQFPWATVVGRSRAAVRRFFGISTGPRPGGVIDLGNRRLTVIPTPGHEAAHITLYDEKAGLLLTGDLLYPGLLTVNDWPAYRRSVVDLAEFAETQTVTFILGAHIEMKRAPGKFFGYPCPFHQPSEHVLQLELRHLQELRRAVDDLGPILREDDRHDDFIIHPAGQPPPPDP